jgi:sugar transferase EpsL
MLDLVCSVVALIILCPALLLVGLLVRINLGSPVIFRQSRPGRHAKLFTLFKFRSKNNAKDANGRSLPDDLRLTKFGRFLRASSCDELPELFNVIRGDMSLVGPRPLLAEYLDRYTPAQARRHEVRPGMTGWAQVNGRQDIPFSVRFIYDVEYVKSYTFFLDVRILFMTVFRLYGAGVRSGQNVLEVDDIGLSDLKGTFHPGGRHD